MKQELVTVSRDGASSEADPGSWNAYCIHAGHFSATCVLARPSLRTSWSGTMELCVGDDVCEFCRLRSKRVHPWHPGQPWKSPSNHCCLFACCRGNSLTGSPLLQGSSAVILGFTKWSLNMPARKLSSKAEERQLTTVSPMAYAAMTALGKRAFSRSVSLSPSNLHSAANNGMLDSPQLHLHSTKC